MQTMTRAEAERIAGRPAPKWATHLVFDSGAYFWTDAVPFDVAGQRWYFPQRMRWAAACVPEPQPSHGQRCWRLVDGEDMRECSHD